MTALRKILFALIGASLVLFAFANSAFASDKKQGVQSTKNQSNSTQSVDDDEIDEAYMDKVLHALIYGADCSSGEISELQTLPKGTISANDKSVIDTAQYADAKSRAIAFLGDILHGGIYDSRQNLYMSANRRISYTLTNGTLKVKAVCEKQGFTINNFSNGDFGLNLSKNPAKEVAIVINFNTSMQKYTDAFKEIAPFVAKHILGENQYAKISLITFSYTRAQDLGTFYDAPSFANALSRAKGMKSNDVVFNRALITAMQNFTKDNGLKKEVYLITNGTPGDMLRAEKMLALTQNLNANIVRNTKENADNRVKIHSFALSKNLDFLKKVAQITGGTYNEANNAYDFKKQILTLSNDGKPFDMRELSNEIRPSKNHKIYDPDDPHNKPKKAQDKEK